MLPRFRSLGRAAAASAAAATLIGQCKAETHSEPIKKKRPRVLITGFNDWQHGDLKGNVWRCRDNPSCRLLLGAASDTPPILRQGPLVQALRSSSCSADFTFQTLPTTWGTANGLDLSGFDVVIHLGLGVYDSYERILLEVGAYNMRGTGRDALSTSGPGEPIEPHASEEHMRMHAPMLQRYARLRAQPSQLTESFTVTEAPSRPDNTFICNETHWRALRAVEASATSRGEADDSPRLAAAYFVHIPFPREKRDDGYEALGAAVAALIARVVELEVG